MRKTVGKSDAGWDRRVCGEHDAEGQEKQDGEGEGLEHFGPALLVWGALTQRHAVIGLDSLIEHCDGLVKRLVTLCARQRAPYAASRLNDA